MKKYLELNLDGSLMRGFESQRDSSACIIMFHGFTGHKMETNRMFIKIDQALEKKHLSSLRFDWFGHGESDVDFSDVTLDLLVRQGKEIIAYAKKRYDKVYLLGFSMGGAIALKCLNHLVDKCILISPAMNMADIASKIYQAGPKDKDGYVHVSGFHLSKTFAASFNHIDYLSEAKTYQRPVLLVHGTKDLSVPIEISQPLKTVFKNLKYVAIEKGDHGYSHPEDMSLLIESIEKFL